MTYVVPSWLAGPVALGLAGLTLGACAIGYRGRIDSRDEKVTSLSAQFLYLDQVLAGVTVTSVDVRPDVDSEGRPDARYGVPLGFRVLDTNPGDNDGRWELWPFVGGIRDGSGWGVDGGLHLRYQRLGYLELGLQRTFGDLADTQGFLGFGVDLGRMDSCGCLPF